jgi:nitroreductase
MAEVADSVLSAIAARKSVRTFDGRPIEKEVLERCLEAARLAPSWANKQCWQFVLVTGKEEIDRLGIVPAQIKGASALLVACGNPRRSGDREGKQYYLVDVAIATEHFVLAAWEQGLGTCWVGAFKEDKVRKALGIPADIRVVALIPTGYPADKEGLIGKLARRMAGSANRRPLEEIVHREKW